MLAAMKQFPKSAYLKVSGMTYVARMLDKIRLFASGELPEEYHSSLGRFADGWCLDFLRVSHEDLKAQVATGASDEELLEWCFAHGRRLSKADIMVWNAFLTKVGWNDIASARLQQVKAENGLGHRDDIQTMPQFFDVDEGRAP